MCCDVGMILGETKLAKFQLGRSGQHLKVGSEVAALLKWMKKKFDLKFNAFQANWRTRDKLFHAYQYSQGMRRHPITAYGLGRARGCRAGFVLGSGGFFTYIIKAPLQFFLQPDALARSHGALGCLFGLPWACFTFMCRIMMAFIVFWDRILTGLSNKHFGKNYPYYLDITQQVNIHPCKDDGEEDAIAAKGFSDIRQDEIMLALDVASTARKIFNRAKPRYGEEHMAYTVASASDVASAMAHWPKDELLGADDSVALVEAFQKIGDRDISFSVCLLVLRHIIANRIDGASIIAKEAVAQRFRRNSYSQPYEAPDEEAATEVKKVYRRMSVRYNFLQSIKKSESVYSDAEEEDLAV
eukprot:CAMPEP_0183305710 /NCGR_PEP_ID=MMETSP0160_2-20130417/10366_1 /TAXON_ID=2839 ORGANISM="Odontella Sinensis, Strain Grunow 1884" /NCGR_SAMPLE_ID=MMETSP0160_2 /ASSEMBLY_ACC=CAM_ASM_000250 /LENGTH=355 /DNA_ID=CAMNT_0025468957 /DNA_START=13 /DNA_END=1080 /DNA_ORIENTATION=+